MLSLSRWGCLTTLTIRYFNNTPTPGKNSLLDSQFLAIGNLLAQTCRVFQFAGLIYGVSKFSKVLRYTTSVSVLRDTCKNFCKSNGSPCTVHTVILLVVIILYSVITWPPPVLLTTWFSDLALWHHDDEYEQGASAGYGALA